MKNLLKRQQGITALGIFLILGVLACFVLFGLTAFPLYNEYVSLQSTMKSVINQPPAKRSNIKEIRKIFLKNADVNSLRRFDDVNVKELVTVKKSKDGKKKYLNVKYDIDNNLFKNLFLTLKIDETMELTSSGTAPE